MNNYTFLQDKRFLQQLDKLHIKQQFVKITVLNWKEEPLKQIQGIAISGSVNLDGSSSMRRTATLSLFAEEKEDTVTLTFAKNKWIITDIQQKTIRESKIDYKVFVEEYKAALEQEGKDILKTAKELRKHYYWIPSNSELLEADNKIKAQNGSF